MIFYTNFLIPKQHAACIRGPFILIRPEYKEDKGLLAHERVHVEQFWNAPIIHNLRYLISKQYRLDCEVAAYREQLCWYPDNKSLRFAEFIATRYNLAVSKETALNLLRN